MQDEVGDTKSRIRAACWVLAGCMTDVFAEITAPGLLSSCSLCFDRQWRWQNPEPSQLASLSHFVLASSATCLFFMPVVVSVRP